MSPPKHPLRLVERPPFEEGEGAVRLVDLFCGCGGLSLGVAQALREHDVALDVTLAVDTDEDALSVYRSNFPKATISQAKVESLIDGTVGGKWMTATETTLLKEVGGADVLVAGPPCQGHSDLNNHTRRVDPKNLLYLKVIRAVQILGPKVVLIENVPTVVHSKPDVVTKARTHLEAMNYSVADAVLKLASLGVPQTRKRHVLLAVDLPGVDAEEVLDAVTSTTSTPRDLRWAIGDLPDLEHRGLMDLEPRASDENLRRMKKMIQYGWYDLPAADRPPCHQDGNHSYVSMYGRLKWEKPAQTITSGFTSIGQGRYMHPDLPRALTHHEAARLQGFPDYFDFTAADSRTSLAVMIGNAVPPALSHEVMVRLIAEGLCDQL